MFVFKKTRSIPLSTCIAMALAFAGCPPETATVPDVRTMNQSSAAATIASAVLTVGTVIHQYSDAVDVGDIISQEPAAGSRVPPESGVDLVVSMGIEPIIVPSIVGMANEEAILAITAAGLAVGTVSGQYSDTVAAGAIMSQAPPAEQSVAPLSVVDWTTSRGPEPVNVPDVSNLGRAEAESTILAGNLTLGMVTGAYHATVAAEHVISQSPTSGEPVLPGTEVALVVSQGPEPITIPSVVNMSLGEAQLMIAHAGLTVGEVTELYNDTVAAGVVIGQNPAADAQLPPRSAVALSVSRGPQPITVPDVQDMSRTDVELLLMAVGLAVGDITEVYSDTIAADMVISQDPAAGAQLLPQSVVALVVSQGPEMIAVPHMVGQTRAMAEFALTYIQLDVGTITQAYSDTVAAGNVISQNPEAGDWQLRDTTVDLVISLGKVPLPADLDADTTSISLDADNRSAIVTITNLGERGLSWTATSTDDQLTLTPNAHTGDGREVTIRANDFSANYTAQVIFTNLADPGDHETVTVNVTGDPNLICRDNSAVKHIILFIGDGMHLQQEIAASRYLFGTDYGLSFHQLPYQTPMTTWEIHTYNRYAWLFNEPRYHPDTFDPTVGYAPALGGSAPYPMDTVITDGYFLNYLSYYGDTTHDPLAARQPSTDSGDAATAMATGNKTDSSNIAWAAGDPEDGALPSIGERMREATGALFGIVSTVRYNHATPAAFGAHAKHRDESDTIGESMLRHVQPDFIIGGYHPGFQEDGSLNPFAYLRPETYDELLAGTLDYVYAGRQPGVDGTQALSEGFESAAAAGKKLFGLFGGSGTSHGVPVAADSPGAPNLDRITMENPLLHETATVTLDYLRSHENGNGFMVMFEQGNIDPANHDNNYKRMIGSMWDLHMAVQAAVDFVDLPDDQLTWENTLLIVTADHANSYMRLTDDPVLGPGDLPEQEDLPEEPTEKAWEYNFRYPDGEVVYHSKKHTNEPVMLYAMGDAACLFQAYEGLWYPGTRLIDNTHVFQVCAEAVGLDIAEAPDK
jgi:alkaline phosphatase